MEEQQLAFNITDDGIDLLADILVAAHQLIGIEADEQGLSEDVQEQITTLAGAILIQVLRQAAEVDAE